MKHSPATLKFNINIRKAVSMASNSIEGIDKIEYSADWSNFPNSLKIECYLAKRKEAALSADEKRDIAKRVQACFLKQGIKFRQFDKNIIFID